MKGWTAQQDEWLRAMYPRKSNRDIAHILGRSYSAIKNRAVVLGLKKSGNYKNPGCFSKGLDPWNKGQAFNSGGRSSETRFRPGNRPANHQPVGTEVIDPYGYRKRKVRDDAPTGRGYQNWRFVHVLIWEKHNGRPLPEGHIVRFCDGNPENLDPDNLIEVSRAENAVINRWMAVEDLPEGGLKVLVAAARLKMKARERKKELTT